MAVGATGADRAAGLAADDPSDCLQAGHAAWFVVYAAETNLWANVWWDIVILGFGLLWLIVRPRLGAVLLLALYQWLSIGINALTLYALIYRLPVAQTGVAGMKAALFIHLGLRAYSLLAMGLGYYRIHRLRAAMRPRVRPVARSFAGLGVGVCSWRLPGRSWQPR